MRNSYLIVGIIVVLLVVISFAVLRTRLPQIGRVSTPTPTPIAQATRDEVAVSTHTPAKTAVIDKATLQKNGFVVIHEEQEGVAGGIIGASSLLSTGTHENITVDLVRKSLENEKLFAIVYYDNGDGVFDASGSSPDKPAMGENDSAVLAKIDVSSETSGFQIPATGLGDDSEY